MSAALDWWFAIAVEERVVIVLALLSIAGNGYFLTRIIRRGFWDSRHARMIRVVDGLGLAGATLLAVAFTVEGYYHLTAMSVILGAICMTEVHLCNRYLDKLEA